MNQKDMIEIAGNVIKLEQEALSDLINSVKQNSFFKSLDRIISNKGKLVIMGLGKSGLVGRKIAATLASTGTPSFFVHAGDAAHGDLGMIEKEDMLMLLSFSGETNEVLKVLSYANKNNLDTIGLTGDLGSTLAKNCTYSIHIPVSREACPLGLAPTSSTTATMVMGDILSACLVEMRGFTEEDFAQYHPGGSLGKLLLMKVSDVMTSKNLPIVTLETTLKDTIYTTSKGMQGLAIVVDEHSCIKGLITSGDIRRALMENLKIEEAFSNIYAKDIMNQNPTTITKDISLEEAKAIFKEKQLNALIVIENKKPVGILQIYNI